MRNFFSYLLSPKKLLQAIRDRKVQITGAFVLLFVCLLTFLTILPIFGVLFVKLLWGKGDLIEALYSATMITGVVALGIPVVKWWGQSFVIRGCLRSKQHAELLPKFSIVLLARTFGLVPMVMLLPLKVLILDPGRMVHHIFFPPISSMVITGIDSFVPVTGSFWKFFVVSKSYAYSRPGFALAACLMVMTFFLTYRKIRQLSGLPAGFVFVRVLLAVVLWDAFSVFLLWALPIVML